MAISLAKLGVWRTLTVGLVLEVIHFEVLPHWAELSPRYPGKRELAASVFLFGEYLVLLLSLMVVASASEKFVRSRNFGQTGLITLAWLAYFAFFAFVLRR